MPQDQDTTKPGPDAQDVKSVTDERRRFIRTTTILKARLLTRHGGVDGTVMDASLNGVKVWTSGNIPVGSPVTLVLAGAVHFGGEVVWRRGETLGICFRDDPEKVAAIMAALLPQRCLQIGHA